MTYRQRSAHLRSEVPQPALICTLTRPIQEHVEIAQTKTLEAGVRTLLALVAAEIDTDDAVVIRWMRLR